MVRKRKKTKNLSKDTYEPPVAEYVYNTNYNLKVDISLIKHGGLGLFTMENIPKNTFIGEYIGEVKHTDEPTLSTYCLSLKSDYFIDAYDYPRCVFGMINDCRFSDYTYNCIFKIYADKAEVWSICDIDAGSEMYLNYGDEFWTYR